MSQKHNISRGEIVKKASINTISAKTSSDYTELGEGKAFPFQLRIRKSLSVSFTLGCKVLMVMNMPKKLFFNWQVIYYNTGLI